MWSAYIVNLSWLQMWDGIEQDAEGYTMPKYTLDDLNELMKGVLVVACYPS